ncbi:FERM domain-containing protein 6 [Danio aesculapii]|uniref:FERM domain-containing protein 6 n=1 Tax=Danio aesculapii TaxID=1142201 RepID=UPI0024C05051|nr:FERM domain-containing protein 6 [Danio aesculapii]
MKNQRRELSVILPNNKELSLTVGVKDRGQEVFNQLSELLGISELHLFGLSVVKDNQPLFLDLEKKLSLYLPKSWKKNSAKEKVILSLRVQYFVENAQLIVNREARQLYYAELKGRVLRSECFEQEGLYFQLVAYALQADLGNYQDQKFQYFSPLAYFPLWIVQKHGKDYILEHTPTLHKELKGMPSSEAALLFLQDVFTLIDVPVTIYRLFKGKRKTQNCVILGLTLKGLQISEMLNGEHQFLYNLPWSTIHSISYQGRKFEIRAEVLFEKSLRLFSCSILHAKHLLQHISNSHRMHLNTKRLIAQSKHTITLPCTTYGGRHREMYITDGADLDMEDSDDELPHMKLFLNQKPFTGTTECGNVKDSGEEYSLEMSVDEPEEMFVDDPEDVLRLFELLEGVSVDDPLLLPISQWKDLTEMNDI